MMNCTSVNGSQLLWSYAVAQSRHSSRDTSSLQG